LQDIILIMSVLVLTFMHPMGLKDRVGGISNERQMQ
jgi:hypothetical protein